MLFLVDRILAHIAQKASPVSDIVKWDCAKQTFVKSKLPEMRLWEKTIIYSHFAHTCIYSIIYTNLYTAIVEKMYVIPRWDKIRKIDNSAI